MIYFMRIESRGLIKIGTTVTLSNRMESHRAYWPGLTLLRVLDGGRDEEQEIHRRFDHLRVPSINTQQLGSRKELFCPGPDLIHFMRNHCRKPDPLDMLHEDSCGIPYLQAYFSSEVSEMLRKQAKHHGFSIGEYTRRLLVAALRRDSGFADPPPER